jgi:hypothetical protein
MLIYKKYVDVFIICVHTKFHMPNFNGLLLNHHQIEG